MIDLTFIHLAEMFVLALVAGVVDSMAGGGGLLIVPGLLATGMNPVSALATNKFQGMFSSLGAAFHFWRKGHFNPREHVVPAFVAFSFSFLGAASLFFVQPAVLEIALPFVLIGIALWVLFSPRLGDVPRRARLQPLAYALTMVPLIGFYDGFLGPASSMFLTLGGVALQGLTLGQATIRAQAYNVMNNLGALTLFLFSGHVVWSYGIVMAIGMALGGQIGARLVLRYGAPFIRPFLVVASVVISAKLLWDQPLVKTLLGIPS